MVYFAAFRLILVLLLVTSVFYFMLSWYSRSMRRGKLENRWAEKGATGDRDTYVKEGLERYDRSLRRKLLLLVFVAPFAIVASMIYVTNFL